MKCWFFIWLGVAALGGVATRTAAQSQVSSARTSAGLDQAINAYVNQAYAGLFALYKELHANPELSFQEQKTAAQLARQLKSLGYKVTERVGGNGVVAVLENGPGPTVLVRTDLDGLPVLEQTGLPYASKASGRNEQGEEVPVMHACGHDVHMTVWAGLAQTLAQFKKDWKGTVVLIGQPAEERGGGAKPMLEDGLFTRFPTPDYGLALHVNAGLEAGKVGYTEGVGGHGAIPQSAKDPIVLASQIVLALQTIVSRELPPMEPAVVTVGSIQGGASFNVIPEEVKLQLTIRSYSEEVREQTIASIRRICKGLAEGAGMPADRMPIVTLRGQFTPFAYNDIPLTRRLAASHARVVGAENVVAVPASMVGEDFAFYGRTEHKVPICMYWLGTVYPQRLQESREKGIALPSLHSSAFAPSPEATIKTGIRTMAAAVLDLLQGEK
jgi:amidohydrolase